MRVLDLARYNIPEKIIESWISQISDCGFAIADLTQNPYRPSSSGLPVGYRLQIYSVKFHEGNRI